jgi:S1-C subfamily serine protease
MNIVLLLLLLLSISSFAGEGFSADAFNVPDVARYAWNNSFGVWSKTGTKRGSGVLVFKDKDQRTGQYYGYFLSNAHVVEPNCGYKLGWCQGLYLSDSLGFDSKKFEYIRSTKEVLFDDVEVVDISREAELALLRTKISGTQFTSSSFAPARWDPSCKQVVDSEVLLIGWPGAYLRPTAPGLLYGKSEHDLKRVSKGVMVSFGTTVTLRSYNLAYKVDTSTADSLPGNSGGVAVNPKTGYAIGIVVGKAARGNNEYSYAGNENSVPKEYHSVILPCAEVKAFLNKNGVLWKRDY